MSHEETPLEGESLESEKIRNLEEKIAFLEDNLSTMSDEFFAQQQKLDEVKEKLVLLAEKMRGIQSTGTEPQEILDEKPPHY